VDSFVFAEVMEGTFAKKGERHLRPFCFELNVKVPLSLPLMRLWTVQVVGDATGVVYIDGFAEEVPTSGKLEISPLYKRRIHYALSFVADDGNNYLFDGTKLINWLKPISTLTTLPGTVTNDAKDTVGSGLLHFSLIKHLPGLVRSLRLG
jgi:hypothetical protein